MTSKGVGKTRKNLASVILLAIREQGINHDRTVDKIIDKIGHI